MLAGIDLLAQKSCLKNHLTHTLTHNRIDFSVKWSPKSGHEKLTHYPGLFYCNEGDFLALFERVALVQFGIK